MPSCRIQKSLDSLGFLRESLNDLGIITTRHNIPSAELGIRDIFCSAGLCRAAGAILQKTLRNRSFSFLQLGIIRYPKARRAFNNAHRLGLNHATAKTITASPMASSNHLVTPAW